MVKVSTGMITGAIVALVMAVVFLSMLPTLIPTATKAVHNLSDAIGNDGENIGTGAAALGDNIDDWTGYFWVVGPLVLVIGVVLSLFLKGRR